MTAPFAENASRRDCSYAESTSRWLLTEEALEVVPESGRLEATPANGPEAGAGGLAGPLGTLGAKFDCGIAGREGVAG